MNKSRLLTLSVVLALSGIGSAFAQAPALSAGTYKLAIGSKAPCDVTVTADGDLTLAPNCEAGANVHQWALTAAGYKILTPSGETYAVLKANGEGFTVADQHKVVLSH